MTPTVHLHIGEPKSGTTYLQGILQKNRVELKARGVMIPEQREQIRAAQDAIRSKADGALWRAMATMLMEWHGSDALITMETLCRADAAAVRRAIEVFEGTDLRVYITVRDLIRTLPAQWQQSTQHRKTWSWSEYLSSVVEGRAEEPAHRNFWSQHDLAKTIECWSAAIAPENITVVTVPQPGAEPCLLWDRFADALGIDGDGYQMVGSSNESLGAVSAELLRRLNIVLKPADLAEREYNTAVRALLARQILVGRRNQEPRVELPESASGWVQRESARIIDAVRTSGVRVVGDVEELVPPLSALSNASTEVSDADLVDTAIDAVRGLVEELARR